MTTDTTIPDSELTPYQRWYKKNREKLNAQRRERYASDPEYNEKARKQAADYAQRRREEDREKA